jgi:selenocysteine lyase/cysteine desulfurase
MYAPFGVGVLVGPRKTFEKGEPVYKGGGDVRLVSQKFIQWAEPPAKDEAGTPNIMGVNALVDAVKNLNMIGLDAIHQHENMLIHYAVDRLKNIPGIDLYCYDKKEDERVALISFTLEGMPHPLLAEILSREGGIAVRDGMFCAHPYIEKMLDLTDKDIEYYRTNKDVLIPGMVRISFGLYNNVSEVNHLIKLLDNISRNMKSYLSLYKPLMS